jgi:hypothetical protein
VSDPAASYAFLPWLRRGVVREIARRDGMMTGEPRASVPVTLVLDAAGDQRDVTAGIELFGPGEVAAIDPRPIIRTIPRADEVDAEPTSFPAVEFEQPDFPWRFTPARADAARSRLRPWLVLAVLAEDEIEEETPPLGDGTLASVTVTAAAALPRLSQSWAWAHVQVDGFDATSETLDDVVREAPQRVRSRLLAPRRLDRRTRYRALLVPAFERGRRAGLREPLDDTVDALVEAWQADATHVRVPFYHGWSFQTGDVGDFETLVRRLEARVVDEGIGLRPMDVSVPDPALPAAANDPLAMEGALLSPAAQSTPWDAAERATFVAALADLLNRPSEALSQAGSPRTVAPPLWVRWQAARERLETAAGARPLWLHELNSDPRLRASAGLGAEVVRANDQQLMAEAWSQVEGILETNAELRRAQVSREASRRLLDRHLAPLQTDAFLAVTAPMHSHFSLSPETVHEVLRRSPIPPGVLSGGMRRIQRSAGPLGRRMARVREPGTAPLLERLNRGDVRARPPLAIPDSILTRGRFAELLARAGALPGHGRAALLLGLLALLLALVAVLLLFVLWLLGLVALAVAVLVNVAAVVAWRRGRQRERVRRVLEGTATPEDVRDLTPALDYVPGVGTPGAWGRDPIPAEDVSPADARAATERFQDAFADLVGEVNAPPRAGPELVVADLPAVAVGLLARMDPARTIHAAIGHRLQIADWVTWEFEDPLEPIMAAPHIDTPMYEPLRDLGQDWLMPGVGAIPPDTVTLLVTNQRFIEAYMAGLSHEMARELLYHEYPTDQRGTYFRQFWDVRGVVGADHAAPDPETLRDIAHIHAWPGASVLGAHTGRTPPPRAGHLVLLVKGEVLRRYPTTLVYAIRTKIGDDGRRTLGEEEAFPVFEGRLDPDISFFGFDLLPDEARGDPDPRADPGWYFVLQEQPTEPVFGLDPDDGRYAALPASWNELNWAQLAEDEPTLAALAYIDLDAALPDTTAVVPAGGEPSLAWHAESGRGAAGSNGSDLAYVTLQRPFRVAVHGSDMLPPEPGP